MQTHSTTIDRPSGKTRLVAIMMAAIFVCFAMSLALVAVLTFLKFDRIYLDTYAQRYDPVAREARDVIERSLGPGISLEANVAGGVAINRLAEQHEGQVAIFLQSVDGSVIATTPNAPDIGEASPNATDLLAETGLLRSATPDHFTTSAVIRNAGAVVGIVTVAFDAGPANAALAKLQARMRAAAIGLFVVFAPVFALLVFFAIFPKERLFAREAASMRRMADGQSANNTDLVLGASAVIADLDRSDAGGR